MGVVLGWRVGIGQQAARTVWSLDTSAPGVARSSTAAWWKATVATMPRAVNLTDTAQPSRKPVTATQKTLAGPERPRVTEAKDAPRAATSKKYIQASHTMMRACGGGEASGHTKTKTYKVVTHL